MIAQPTTEFSALLRTRWFWLAGGAVVIAQLVAFWLLCSWQVRVAEERDAAVQGQRAAFVDCMRDSSQALAGGCASSVATAR